MKKKIAEFAKDAGGHKTRAKVAASSSNPRTPFIHPDRRWKNHSFGNAMSESALNYHFGKIYRLALNKLNQLTYSTPLGSLSLPQIVHDHSHDASSPQIRQLASDCYCHSAFWLSFCSPPYVVPPGDLILSSLIRDFGSFDSFQTEFTRVALDHFGSGFVWLV